MINKNKTEVFNSYEDFLKRKDKSINGVCKKFIAIAPNYKKDNKTNTACWNCEGCINCNNCINSARCVGCEYCVDCIDLTNSSYCRECERSNNLLGNQRLTNCKI